LLALSIYGLFCVLQDTWEWLRQFYQRAIPEITVLLVVKNREHDIEYIIRFLAEKITACADSEKYDIVVVDRGSDDLTAPILERLSEEFEFITYVSMPNSIHFLAGLPLCRGKAVYVLDLNNRLSVAELYTAAEMLLK
jgi:glycosyltransferase involved in cell wall biosynthesis